jgi:hypothetical protein
MRKYSTNLGFVDLLFNLLVGFVSLLLIAFLLINPIADDGKIDPVTEFIINVQWPDNSSIDIDLWVQGPEGTIVSFKQKDGNYMVLERDDLGISNDFVMINGEPKIIRRNIETLMINTILEGEYFINVHNYNHNKPLKDGEDYPVPVEVTLIKMTPFSNIFTLKTTLSFRQETTIASFLVNRNGVVNDIRTDVQIPLYYKGIAEHTPEPVSPTFMNISPANRINEQVWDGVQWGFGP